MERTFGYTNLMPFLHKVVVVVVVVAVVVVGIIPVSPHLMIQFQSFCLFITNLNIYFKTNFIMCFLLE